MLSLRNVDQYYGGSHILRGMSLQVPGSGVTALLGRNGVGKTTLLRAIMGVVPVRSGEITFDGQPLRPLDASARVRLGLGYVPQGREIFPRLTVEENLRMGLATRPRGTPIPDELFELFPVLRTMLRRRGGDLSGGQQQQLAIARALAMKPRLLILDEPTEGIQPSVVTEIQEAILALTRRGGLSVFLVEQHVGFALSAASTYYVLESGRVTGAGDGGAASTDAVRAAMAI